MLYLVRDFCVAGISLRTCDSPLQKLPNVEDQVLFRGFVYFVYDVVYPGFDYGTLK